MIRPVFAIAAGLFCALLGLRFSASIQDEARQLRQWTDILSRLSILIGEAAASLPDALRLSADDTHPPDMLLHAMADMMQAHPLTTPADAFIRLCPSCSGHDTLLRMFNRLGRGSPENRQQAVQQAIQELSLMTAQAEERAAKDVKLYRILGCTGGACLAILLL